MIDPRLFVLSFENRRVQESNKQYFLPTVQIKDYNVMIDWRNFFDQPVKNDLRTGQGNDYTTGCLLDYPYFKIF